MDDFPTDNLQDRRHAASILGIALACIAYVAAHRFGHPLFYYLPQVEEWTLDAPPSFVNMGYYGSIPYGLAGFLVGWGLAKIPAVAAWIDTPGRARALTVTATIAVAGSLLYHLVVELTGHMQS